MAAQKSVVFSFGANGTQNVISSGSGVIINAISAIGIITNAAITSIGIFQLTDAAGTPVVLFQRNFLGTTSIGDFLNVSGLNIPTTVTGGLNIVISSLGAGAFIAGTVVYTTP